MRALERERLALLPSDEQSKQLIIPVIYRGLKNYPDDLKNTLYLNFERFSLYEAKMIRNRKFAQDIKSLAEYIKERVDAFTATGQNPWADCDGVTLPSDNDVLPLIQNYNPQPFPFHTI